MHPQNEYGLQIIEIWLIHNYSSFLIKIDLIFIAVLNTLTIFKKGTQQEFPKFHE